MLLIAIAWLYVVLMVAVVEATGGSLLGAMFTFVLYGVLPLGIVMHLFLYPARKRARRAAEAAASALDPDQCSHAAGEAVSPERKEP